MIDYNLPPLKKISILDFPVYYLNDQLHSHSPKSQEKNKTILQRLKHQKVWPKTQK